MGLVPPPDTVRRHLHQSEIAFPIRYVALDRLDQGFNGDPPPLNWSTLRYVFGHEKEDRNAEKAPQA